MEFCPLQQAPQLPLHDNHPQLHWSGAVGEGGGMERFTYYYYGEAMIRPFIFWSQG